MYRTANLNDADGDERTLAISQLKRPMQQPV